MANRLVAQDKFYPNKFPLSDVKLLDDPGHCLSAKAMNYAATGNKNCKTCMEYRLSELTVCQKANALNNSEWGIGYVGGFPDSKKLWTAFKKGDFRICNSAWAPFKT